MAEQTKITTGLGKAELHRVLVCGYDLASNLERRHAARQFRHSLLRYANSATFAPTQELSLDFCRRLLGVRKTGNQ